MLALALALGAAACLGFQEPSGPRQVLPDGTVVELCAVTYGKHHEFFAGNWWQRTVGRLLAEDGPIIGVVNTGARTRVLIRAMRPNPFWRPGPSVADNCAATETYKDEPVLWFRIRESSTAGAGGVYS